VSPARKREAVEHLQEKFDASERRACEVVDQPRSTQRYTGQTQDDEPKLVSRMLELVRERPRFGYRRIAALLRAEGWAVNVKRVYRLWRREGLKVPRKTRKRRGKGTSANACHVRRAEHQDHVWTWDFVFDRTASGTTLKWLSIVDEYTRECLALKVGRSITSEDVIDTLAELFAMRGVPRCVRSDNGPEFIAQAIGRWFEKTGVAALYIEPGSPWENGYAESFHSRLRDEFLGMHEFADLREARRLTAAWREDYNHRRPHSSLGYRTPMEFAAGGANSVRATPSLRRHPRQSKEPLPVT
jgi:transposase InsO family protein